MAQISGKILTANSKTIVGAINSHAMDRSDMPRIREAMGAGVAWATPSPSMEELVSVTDVTWVSLAELWHGCPA